VIRRGLRRVVAAQLDLFVEEHADLLEACERAETAYDAASRDEAEERYGDYMDLVDEVNDLLTDMRDHYSAGLEERAAEDYEALFARAVGRRLRRFRVGP
jgi:hypothetical protein